MSGAVLILLFPTGWQAGLSYQEENEKPLRLEQKSSYLLSFTQKPPAVQQVNK